MSDLAEKFFKTPIPESVWHYTTLGGLEGILSSNTVWATEAHYTTDASEFIHARAVTLDFLESIKPDDEGMARGKQAGLEMLVHAFDEGVLSPSKTEVFVASFSSAEDLKSQWMEYADGGRGVSIAFNLRAIRPPQEFGYAVTFAPCVYFEVEKKALLEAALSHFINMIARLYRDTGSKQWAAQQLRDWRRVDNIYSLKFDRAAFDAEMQRRFDEKLHTALARTSFDLLRLASHCKNAAFHQECEWRLSLPHSKNKPLTQNKVLYRGVNQNIPYLAHNLFQEKLPITHVLAGPLCQHVTQVEEILAKYAYNAAVTKSTIPIRSANEIR